MTLDSFRQPERPARTAAAPRWRALAGLLAAWLCTSPAHAADAASAPASAASAPAETDVAADGATRLRFNGFGTVGLVDVAPSGDGWGFRREDTQPARHDNAVRWDVDSRLGLQANWSPSERWDLVGQVVLKPYAHQATDEEAITWAFAAFHPTPDWTIRVGRTSPDLFLLSDVRNVGFAYPWVRPSVDFYGWVPISNLDGADVTREWNLGASRWRAKLFAGRSRVTLASSHDDGDTLATADPLAGGTLTVEDNGLTVKATFAEAHTRPDNSAGAAALHDGFDALAQLGIPVVSDQAAALRDAFPAGTFLTRYSALSAAWEHDAWQLQAEIARTNGNFVISNGWYGYMSAAWRTGNKTFFGMVGRSKQTFDPLPEPNWVPILTPLVGPALAAQAQYAGTDIADSYNLAREDQRSLSLGMRIDLNPQLALKLQFDDYLSAPWGGGMWAYDTADSHHARVFSAGLDFIF